MGVFTKIFGKSTKAQNGSTTLEYQSGGLSELSGFRGNVYDNDIARSAIWTNAKNVGKLNPKHIRRTEGKYDVFPMPKVKRLLTRPNQYMSMSVFLNKMATQCFKKNNAFALVRFDGQGWVEGIYPISYTYAKVIERMGFCYVCFTLPDGKTLTVKYSELIHIRAHLDEKDVLGESNASALSPIMEVLQTTDQGIVSAIRKSAVIRWILKFQHVLNPEDKKEQVNEFVKNYLSIGNSGGAAASEPRYEAEQVKNEGYVPNAAMMDRAKARIYSYFGVSDEIVQARFTEDQWNAYYENTIEPFAIQLSEEFTEKLFTPHERDCGNEIIFEANRLQYASNNTKVSVAKFLADIGGAELDQILEIFNMAPLGGEAGKRRVQTLNMVNADKADQYQLGDSKKKKEQEPEPDAEPEADKSKQKKGAKDDG